MYVRPLTGRGLSGATHSRGRVIVTLTIAKKEIYSCEWNRGSMYIY